MNKTAWTIKKKYDTSWKTAYNISYRAYHNRYINTAYEIILISLVALTFI